MKWFGVLCIFLLTMIATCGCVVLLNQDVELSEKTGNILWAIASPAMGVSNWVWNEQRLAVAFVGIGQSELVSINCVDGSVAKRLSINDGTVVRDSVNLLATASVDEVVRYDAELNPTVLRVVSPEPFSKTVSVLLNSVAYYAMQRSAEGVYVRCFDLTGEEIWKAEVPRPNLMLESMLTEVRLFLDGQILLVYGLDVQGVTALDAVTGKQKWYYPGPNGIISALQQCSQGYLVAGIESEIQGGEVALLAKTGETLFSTTLPAPVFGTCVTTDLGSESYWCLSGAGDAIGPLSRNALYKVDPQGAELLLDGVAYQGPMSVLAVSSYALVCGYDDGQLHLVGTDGSRRSIAFAEAGEFLNPMLMCVNEGIAYVAVSGNNTPRLNTLLAVDLGLEQ